MVVGIGLDVGDMTGLGEDASPGTVTLSVAHLLALLAKRPHCYIVVGERRFEEHGVSNMECSQVSSPECDVASEAAVTAEPAVQRPETQGWQQVGGEMAQVRLAAVIAKQAFEQHAAEVAALDCPPEEDDDNDGDALASAAPPAKCLPIKRAVGLHDDDALLKEAAEQARQEAEALEAAKRASAGEREEIPAQRVPPKPPTSPPTSRCRGCSTRGGKNRIHWVAGRRPCHEQCSLQRRPPTSQAGE